MKKLLFLLLCLFSLSGSGSAQTMLGNRFRADTTTKVYLLLSIGQSQCSGRAETARLANTNFNYKGIAAGYPTHRVAQAQYTTTPSNVYIYNKGNDKTNGNIEADNGAWQAYTAGSNDHIDLAAAPLFVNFGPELSLSTQLSDATGKAIYVAKFGVGGTALTNNTTTTDPGCWNYTLRYQAVEYILKRAVRDLRTAQPTKRIVFLGVLWMQGEQDATTAQTAATYEAEFNSLKRYVDNSIKETLNLRQPYPWILAKLSFNQDAAETVINTAITSIDTNNSDCYSIDLSSYPRKYDLTTTEATPVAKVAITTGNTPTNSVNGADNYHGSYIYQLAAGELTYNIMSPYLFLP
ncbi:MAG: sialate O-acetylesterase [Bacteroidota bacterium]